MIKNLIYFQYLYFYNCADYIINKLEKWRKEELIELIDLYRELTDVHILEKINEILEKENDEFKKEILKIKLN